MKFKHIVVILVVLIVDQAVKFGIHASMALGESIRVIPGFFRITYLQNTGAAWSMLEGKMVFFYIVSIVFLIAMVYFYRSTPTSDTRTQFGILLMVGGTLGNFIDRLLFQHVRDYIDVIVFGYDFPVFNIADASLCIGVGVIILSLIVEHYGGCKVCGK